MPAEDPVSDPCGRRVVAVLALYALLGGVISFSGWALDVPRLTDWLKAGVSIQPNAAVLMAVAGAGLLLQRSSRRFALAIGSVVALFGGLTLLQYIVGADFGFNHQLLFGRTWGHAATLSPGRPGPPASSSFLLIGAALILLSAPGRQASRRVVPMIGVAVCALMMFSLMGYLFGARNFYSIPSLSAIALQTASMLLALAIGLIVSVPEHQPMLLLREHSTAGMMARTVLPALVVMIPSVIWLRVEGERLNLYDAGTSRALGAVALVFGTTALMWTALLALRRREQRERESEAWLAGQKEALQAAVNGEALDVSLGALVRTAIEQLGGDTRAAFYLVKPDGANLDYVVGESEIHADFVDGLKIGSGSLACGLAVHTGRPVISRDVRTEPLWKPWLWLADKYDFRGCWSFPVHSSAGRVVGTFALYLRKPRDATSRDHALANMMTQTANIIINRNEAVAALRDSEQRFRELVSVITDVPWVTDPQGAFVVPQPAWEGFTGQIWDEHKGFGWANALHPDDRERVKAIWLKACAEKTLFESRGLLWHAPSQSYHYYVGRATPVLNDDGSVLEWVGACTDVHEQKLAERALREADRRKDEFLASLAHELRNPLAPVRNALQILHLKEPAVPELRWARDVIDRQIQHLARLIDDLMDVSRISCGKIELQRERVELADIVQAAVEATRPLIEQCGHELSMELPTQPVYLDADLTRLAQVFCNLLNNAAKYSERGGRIVLTAECRGNEAVVSVRDTGVGIPADMLLRVFEMFTQVDRSLEKSQGGLGLGLSLVKRLVEMHGGRVEARSEGLGKGSEFVVRLPILIEPMPTERQTRHAQLGAPPTSSHRVLVVDDNRDAADSLEMMLQIMGNDVCTAYDGVEAVRVAGEFRPDLVLLDIGLPKSNGYDTARAIRSEPWGKSMVLVAVTGRGQEEDRRRSKEAGFDQHLVKPVAPSTVMELLATLPARSGRTS